MSGKLGRPSLMSNVAVVLITLATHRMGAALSLHHGGRESPTQTIESQDTSRFISIRCQTSAAKNLGKTDTGPSHVLRATAHGLAPLGLPEALWRADLATE